MRNGYGWVALALWAGAGLWGCAAGAPEQFASDAGPVGGNLGPGNGTLPSGGSGGHAGSSGTGGTGSGTSGRGGSSGAGSGGAAPPPPGGGPGPDDGGMSTMPDGGPAVTDDAGPGDCGDTKKNGKETGTDCGGPDCDPCADGKGCVVGSDCESDYCGSGFLCATPGCDDMTKNGDETDTDCGGPDCPKCINNRACSEDGDCMSDSCVSDKCACSAITDCGANECGQKPDGCTSTVTCSHTCDAATEMCQGNACVPLPTMCVVSSCSGCSGLNVPCCKNDESCGCALLGFLGCN